MTDVSKDQAPSGAPPNCAVLVLCVECGDGAEVPLPMDHRSLAFYLAHRGWFVTTMTPPGQGPEVPILFGALCTTCAQKVYAPEVFKAADERRQQMLQAAQAAQGAPR